MSYVISILDFGMGIIMFRFALFLFALMLSFESMAYTAGEFDAQCGIAFAKANEESYKLSSSIPTGATLAEGGMALHKMMSCSMYIDGLVSGLTLGGKLGISLHVMSVAKEVDGNADMNVIQAAIGRVTDKAIDQGLLPGFCATNAMQMGRVFHQYIEKHPEKEGFSAESVLFLAWKEAFPPPCKKE